MNTALLQSLQARWKALAPRERLMLSAAAWVVGLGLVWWLALQPALKTLKAAGAQRIELDRQMQVMQSLRAEASALQSQAKLSHSEAQQALQDAVKQRLGGSGQLNVVGERVTVSFKAQSGDTLAQWLAQARANAHALPTEAKLTRTPTAANASPGAAVTWDGSIVFRLP